MYYRIYQYVVILPLTIGSCSQTELLYNIKQGTVDNLPSYGDTFAFLLHKFFPGSVVLFKVQPVYAVGPTPKHMAERHSSAYILLAFARYVTT
jgi:hypothetical protein